jgi:hypothetical protein
MASVPAQEGGLIENKRRRDKVRVDGGCAGSDDVLGIMLVSGGEMMRV